MEGSDTKAAQEGQDFAPYGVAIPAPTEPLTEHDDRPPAPSASSPADDGPRKLAFELWEGVGCCPIPYKPGHVIFDLGRWLRRATDEEVAQVVDLLEAMPAPKGGSK
jgi:hypothetical protein